jgi:O-antigen biosynthesis protein WbqP
LGTDDERRRGPAPHGDVVSSVDVSSAGKRLADWALVVASLPVFISVGLIVSVAVRFTSRGPILYWSQRVGQHDRLFLMPKFRTMRVDTPAVATHLLENCDAYLTPIGAFLRKTSLDELPQIWSILIGDMSFVGPRPALFNQFDLIELRRKYGVEALKPGLTGWAQVNGRDDLTIPEKVRFDDEYLARQSLRFDMYILLMSVAKVLRHEGVSH